MRPINRRRETGVVLALAALYYLLPAIAVGPVPDMLGVPVVLALCVGVPGVAVVRMMRARPRDLLERMAVVASLGLAALLAACFAWALFGLDLDAFRLALPPLVLVTFALAGPVERTVPPRPLGRPERLGLTALALALIALALAVAVTGPPVDFHKDTIDHVGYINEIVRTQEAFPTTAVYADAGANGADLRKSLLHCAYALVARQTGVGALRALTALGPYLVIILVLGIYSAAFTLFRSRAVAVVSAFLFILSFDGGLADVTWRTAFYPNRFGVGMLALMTASAMAYLHTRSRMSLAMCVAFAFGAVAVHIQFAVFCAMVVAIIAAWKTCSPLERWVEHLGRAARVGLAVGAGLVPYGLFRYLTAYQTNDLHRQVQGAVFVAGDWFVADPTRLWQSMGLVGLAAFVAIVPTWRARREVPGVGFACASLFSLLLIQFNPIVTPLLYEVVTYLVYRLDRVAPFYMLVAFVLAAPAARDGRFARPRWRTGALVLAVVAVLASLTPLFGRNAFSPRFLAAERANTLGPNSPKMTALATRLPAGSVIASDPVTSYVASAFTPHAVVCTFDQHAPPNDLEFAARMADARDLMSPFVSTARKLELMRARDATHLVVNLGLPSDISARYWTGEATLLTLTRDALRAPGSGFRGQSIARGLTVFTPSGGPGRRQVAARPPVWDALPAGAKALGLPAGEAELVGARVQNTEASPAGYFGLDLYWRSRRALAAGTYNVSVRFDRADLALPLGGRPFPKLWRKLMEAKDGVRYRHRHDHMILAGMFSPDAWPRDAIVGDSFTLKLPADLAPGRYRVQAVLRRAATPANYRLRDFFYDDDSYAGAAVGEIVVGD